MPVVADGLRTEALARRFSPAEHPRLARILAADGPVRFTDSSLPDPFDGLFAADSDALAHPHACMGCRLVVEGEVIGVLTADALPPAASTPSRTRPWPCSPRWPAPRCGPRS